MKKSDKMLPVPEVGELYHFWDDGKTGPPFEGNEHLLGTTDMCDECYINW